MVIAKLVKALPPDIRQKDAGVSAKGSAQWTNLPLYMLATIALPSTLSIRPGGFLLTPYRVLGIFAFAYILFELLRDRFRWSPPDFFVCIYCFWGASSYLVNLGLASGFQSAGVIVLESFVPYFVARLLVKTVIDLKRVVRLSMRIILLLLPLAIVEAVSKIYLVRLLLGVDTGEFGYSAVRLGLLRAMTTFDHPILYGTFCSSAFSFAWLLLPRRWRLVRAAIIGMSVGLSGSSAAYLASALQIGLLGWDRLAANLRHQWMILGAGAGAALAVLTLLSKRPLSSLLISYLTLNPQTGWIRLAQWNFGWADVSRNWIFGLGGQDWARPAWLSSSVDNFWLVVALNFGIPALFAALAAVGSAIFMASRNANSRLSGVERISLKAWVLTLLAMSLVGLTVDYWKSMHAFFFFLLGLGMFLSDIATTSATKSNIVQASRPRGTLHTRNAVDE